jgi:hypothetical protein
MITSCVGAGVMQQSRSGRLRHRRLPTFKQIGFHAFERVAQRFDLLLCFDGRQALGRMDK